MHIIQKILKKAGAGSGRKILFPINKLVQPWCPRRGVLVIERQLEGIDIIHHEMRSRKEYKLRDGIFERLDRARRYYADLRARMKA